MASIKTLDCFFTQREQVMCVSVVEQLKVECDRGRLVDNPIVSPFHVVKGLHAEVIREEVETVQRMAPGGRMNRTNRRNAALGMLLVMFGVGTLSGQVVTAGKKEQTLASSEYSSNSADETHPALQKRGWRYTVHPSDTLQLTFPLTPEFNQTIIVQPDGYISLLNVGELLAIGQTLPELTELLHKAYGKILRNPVIFVDAKDFEKPYFVVGGQVEKPGKFDWRGEVTVTEAVALAGGFKDTAKHSQVLLFRRVSDEWAEAKLINVKKMLNAKNLREDPVLQPGDMLYVPKNALSKIKPFLPLPTVGMYASPTQF
jgi:polysaccharide biosynthesis/export protein